uniref:Dilute domain-containing protein n=1 Tax=Xiphophorus maculatus TaxID=8083 RepID=A0A3B5QLT5_XIPMA
MQALQKDKENISKEKENLTAQLHEKERTQNGAAPLFLLSALINHFFPLPCHSFEHFFLWFILFMYAECVQKAVQEASAALQSELDEEKMKYQGLLRELTRLEQRYDNLREMNLLTEVHSALALPPGLPASVIFLCVRQADCSGDQARARSLCSSALIAMKRQIPSCWLGGGVKQTSDLDMTALDLIRSLSVLCIQAYQQLLSITETLLQKLIVPALLESETIAGLSGSAVKLVVSRKRAGSDPRPLGADSPTMASVLRQLRALHTALSRQALPQSLAEQAFRQMTYLICASALNNLLLRKDMCCWSRGMQIRYNVSVLEEWLRSQDLAAGGAVATLEPLIQAAQLLQVGKKTDADAQAIVRTCTALSSKQIMKILTLYTPHSDLDEKVSLNFIRTVQVPPASLGRSDSQPPQLLMDVRRAFPVTVPYSPPPALSADDLVIPESLKISFLRRS